MPAPLKLSEGDVTEIRLRLGRGERQVDLAAEFGVNRKTIRRRLDAPESHRAARLQAERRRRSGRRIPHTDRCGADVGRSRQRLSDRQVREIQRRVRMGEWQTELAALFGVNRRTIRRRLDVLEAIEDKRAAARLARQVKRELRKLRQRDVAAAPREPTGEARPEPRGRSTPYVDWLDTRKNLSARALAEARGLLRVRSPDSKEARWVERSEAELLIRQGWLLT